MWIIQKVVRKEGGYVPALPANGGAQFYLKPNSSFMVGKEVQTDPPCLVTGGLSEQGEDPLLWNLFVSPKHAEVTYTKGVAQGQSIGSTPTKLTLKDLGSKSTFVCKQDDSMDIRQLAPNEVYEIQDQDIVRFGTRAYFQFVKVKFSFCFSQIGSAEEDDLVAMCSSLGIARKVENAEDATHIICSKISASVKVLMAVVMQKPIVNVAWLRSFATSTLPYIPIPPTDPLAPEFQPPSSSEDAINNARLSRATLLRSLCVLLADEADKEYEPVLRGAGATIIVLPAAEADLAATRLVIPPQCSSLCLFENNEAKESESSAERARYLSRLQLCRAAADKQASPRPVLTLTTSEVAKAVMQMHVPPAAAEAAAAAAPAAPAAAAAAADAPSSAPAPKPPAGPVPSAARSSAYVAPEELSRSVLEERKRKTERIYEIINKDVEPLSAARTKQDENAGGYQGELKMRHLFKVLKKCVELGMFEREGVIYMDIGAGLGKPSLMVSTLTGAIGIGIEYTSTRVKLNTRAMKLMSDEGILPRNYYCQYGDATLFSLQGVDIVHFYGIAAGDKTHGGLADRFNESTTAEWLILYYEPEKSGGTNKHRGHRSFTRQVKEEYGFMVDFVAEVTGLRLYHGTESISEDDDDAPDGGHSCAYTKRNEGPVDAHRAVFFKKSLEGKRFAKSAHSTASSTFQQLKVGPNKRLVHPEVKALVELAIDEVKRHAAIQANLAEIIGEPAQAGAAAGAAAGATGKTGAAGAAGRSQRSRTQTRRMTASFHGNWETKVPGAESESEAEEEEEEEEEAEEEAEEEEEDDEDVFGDEERRKKRQEEAARRDDWERAERAKLAKLAKQPAGSKKRRKGPAEEEEEDEEYYNELNELRLDASSYHPRAADDSLSC